MNLKSSKLLLLISFLPVWTIRSNLTYIEESTQFEMNYNYDDYNFRKNIALKISQI